MRGNNWHRARVQERTGSGEAEGRQEVLDRGVTGVPADRSEVNRDLGRVVARLERSDAFQQRLSAINSEIVRQLGIRRT